MGTDPRDFQNTKFDKKPSHLTKIRGKRWNSPKTPNFTKKAVTSRWGPTPLDTHKLRKSNSGEISVLLNQIGPSTLEWPFRFSEMHKPKDCSGRSWVWWSKRFRNPRFAETKHPFHIGMAISLRRTSILQASYAKSSFRRDETSLPHWNVRFASAKRAFYRPSNPQKVGPRGGG